MIMGDKKIIEYNELVRVQEQAKGKFIEFSIPKSAFGGFYNLEFSSESKAYSPYLISFILHNNFILYLNDLENFLGKHGFTNLTLETTFPRDKPIVLEYGVESYKDDRKLSGLANLFIRSFNNRISQFDIEIDENEPDDAVGIANMLVTRLLDAISFLKGVPISIREILVKDKSRTYLSRYITVPYLSDETVHASDIEMAMYVPGRITPLLSMYREALSSDNQHYRFLALFRTFEGLEKVIAENSRKLKGEGIPIKRPKIFLKDTEIMRKYFPKYVNRSYKVFFNDYVREKFRNPQAHFNVNKRGQLLLDPREFKHKMLLSTVNSAMLLLLKESITAEIHFMKENKIK